MTGHIEEISPQSQGMEEGKKILQTEPYSYPIRSIATVQSLQELKQWMEKRKRETNGKARFMLEKRYKGQLVSLVYEKGVLVSAHTCKRGIPKQDILSEIRTVKGVPEELPYPDIQNGLEQMPARMEVRGCVVKGDEGFEMRAFQLIGDGLPDSNNIRIYLLEDWRIKDSRVDMSYFDVDVLMNSIQDHANLAFFHQEESDGIVVKIEQSTMRKDVPGVDCFYGWAIAYQWGNNLVYTDLVAVGFDVDRTGEVTTEALIHPVNVYGKYIRAIKIDINHIQELGLCFGDRIEINITDEGAVYIASVDESERKPASQVCRIPDKCPHCSSHLVWEGEKLFCRNEWCSGMAAKRILHTACSVGMKGITEAMVEKMVDNGVYSASALLDYDERMLRDCGIGKATAKKIVSQQEEIKRKKKRGK